MQAQVEPTEDYVKSCTHCVDELVDYLQRIPNEAYRPMKVIKSGSLGKGTEVKDLSDIDLVVVMHDAGSDMLEQRERAINYLEKYLSSNKRCIPDGKTFASVKIKLRDKSDKEIDVDVLPAFIDVDIERNGRQQLNKIYDMMKSNTSFCQAASAALAPIQRDFVKKVPPKVKQLIRLVKYWKKTCLQEMPKKRYPTSYPLELITIGAWQDAGSPENFDMRQGLYHVMLAMKNYRNLRRVWYEHYDKERADRADKCRDFYVIDPSNPYNNIMKRCDVWDDVSRQIGIFLDQRLFKNLMAKRNWQS